MDAKLQKLLDSLPPKGPSSRLEPHLELIGYSGEGEHAFQRERERDFQSEYEQFSERSDAGSLIVPQPCTFVKELLP